MQVEQCGGLRDAIGQNRADLVEQLLLARNDDVGQAWADEVSICKTDFVFPFLFC